ncbi:MAG: substrate-binding domain-containing protein, partial [Muribaculaceae bacterium]|nr:substrate-binding domain-containing protein [Muribaculaceae bacterium]
MKKILIAAVTLLAGINILTSCDSKTGNSTTSGAATIVCDKSFENIMNQEIDVFESIYPKVSIGCQYVSQAEALQRLLSGDTRMA